MNQALKFFIYSKGSPAQVKYMADLGGMNDEEYKVFNMLHMQYTDLAIQEEMGLDRKSYQRIEESVRAKLLIAVFECIHYTMDERTRGA